MNKLQERRRRIGMESVIRNKSTRIPVCFCVDVGGKIGIRQLEEQLNETLLTQIRSRLSLGVSVELSVIAFGDRAQCVRRYQLLRPEERVSLTMQESGKPALKEALRLARRGIRELEVRYLQGGINYVEPAVFLFTGGTGREMTEEERQQLAAAAGNLRIKVFSTDTEDSALKQIAFQGRISSLSDSRYEEIFRNIGQSMEELSASSFRAYRSLMESCTEW